MRAFLRSVVLVAVTLLASGTAFAQDARLQAAEAAYLDVDFEGTRTHAMAALRSGTNGPSELIRIYQLLGIASSALGDEDAARDYFVRMLGLDPEAELDDSVPPRLRNPFLEARGMWTARGAQLGLEIGLDRAASALRVQISDPTDMARRVRVSARLEGAATYETSEYVGHNDVSAPLAGAAEADRIEYYVDIMDMHGNVIFSEGDEFHPAVVGRTEFSNGRGGDEAGGGGGSVIEEPWFWILIGGGLLVAGGITAGVLIDERSRLGIQTSIVFGIE